jgi:hypothetical protein
MDLPEDPFPGNPLPDISEDYEREVSSLALTLAELNARVTAVDIDPAELDEIEKIQEPGDAVLAALSRAELIALIWEILTQWGRTVKYGMGLAEEDLIISYFGDKRKQAQKYRQGGPGNRPREPGQGHQGGLARDGQDGVRVAGPGLPVRLAGVVGGQRHLDVAPGPLHEGAHVVDVRRR